MILRYACIDIETGGLDPAVHPLIEVAWVLEGGTRVSFSLPFNEEDCDEIALEINGWGQRTFAKQIRPRQAMNLMSLHLHKRLLVASPAHFDIGFLEAFWRKNTSEQFPWKHNDILDLKSYAYGVMGLHHAPLKNSRLAKLVHVVDSSDHTALQDAIYTDEMFREVVRYQEEWAEEGGRRVLSMVGPPSTDREVYKGKDRVPRRVKKA